MVVAGLLDPLRLPTMKDETLHDIDRLAQGQVK
jgi:hypothetical protein